MLTSWIQVILVSMIANLSRLLARNNLRHGMSNDFQQIEAAIPWFRDASPYINAHRGKTMVLCMPDHLLNSEILTTLIQDLTLLSHLGVRLVLSFGLRAQVDARLEQSQNSSRVVDGRRITDDAALSAIITASGLARTKLEAQLSMGLPNTPMAGAHLSVCSGNFVTAQPFGIHDGIDYLHTGNVRQVHADMLATALQSGHLVLLPPLGYSLTGDIFNLPAEEVAAAAAIALGADKLIYFVPGLPIDAAGKQVRDANIGKMEKLGPQQSDEELSRTIGRAVEACKNGIPRVHLLSSTDPNGLLRELFSRDGSGTLITAEHWESVRAASIQDVGGIIELITPMQANGSLATRSREQLELDIEQFVVCEREGMVIACAALYLDEINDANGNSLAEIACIATHPHYRGAGYADRLLGHLEDKARSAGRQRVMLLSTRTGHWFVERGYIESNFNMLPSSRQDSYNRQRNSTFYMKQL